MRSTLTIPFVGAGASGDSRGESWATLEQVYKESSPADFSDLSRMLALVHGGLSAFEYVADGCSYLVIDGDTITVSLDFYVWPSAMDLPYSIDADFGDISIPIAFEEHRSFDVPFDNRDSAQLPYILSGSMTAEMPFINSDGSVMAAPPEITVDDALVTLSDAATVVLRANGTVRGYRHTLSMEFIKEAGTAIEDIKNTLILSWENNGETETDTLDIAIPPCVTDLLKECPDGSVLGVIGCFGRDCDDKDPYFAVYYSTCSGEVLLTKWEGT